MRPKLAWKMPRHSGDHRGSWPINPKKYPPSKDSDKRLAPRRRCCHHNVGEQPDHPDLCAVVDPDPPFGALAAHKAFEAPLLFQSRASSQIISLFDGPSMSTPPTGGNFLETWANERLKLDPNTFGTILTVSDVCTRSSPSRM